VQQNERQKSLFDKFSDEEDLNFILNAIFRHTKLLPDLLALRADHEDGDLLIVKILFMSKISNHEKDAGEHAHNLSVKKVFCIKHCQ